MLHEVSAQVPGLHVHGRSPMTRIGILISALILLAFASRLTRQHSSIRLMELWASYRASKTTQLPKLQIALRSRRHQ